MAGIIVIILAGLIACKERTNMLKLKETRLKKFIERGNKNGNSKRGGIKNCNKKR
jgi:hypothetical protein